jgi:hypothetical protein
LEPTEVEPAIVADSPADVAAKGDWRTRWLLLLPALPITMPLLCMPLLAPMDDRLLLAAAAATRRLLLADCWRSLCLLLLAPDVAPAGLPAVPLLSTEPAGPVMLLAILLHRA